MKTVNQKISFKVLLAYYLAAIGGLLAYKFVLPIPYDSPYHIGMVRFLTLAGALTALFYVVTFRFGSAKRLVRDYFSSVNHPVNLAIFRIYFFYFLLNSLNPDKVLFFSDFPRELMFLPLGTGWAGGIVPLDESWLRAAIVLFKLFCWMGLLGIFTKFSTVMTAVLFYYAWGVPQLFGKVNHYHNLLWFNMILAFSPCADYLSVDAIFKSWRRADKGVVSPPPPSRAYDLPIKIVWLLFGISYFWPGFWKLWENGTAWILGDGLKLHLYAKWADLEWMPVFRIDQYPILCNLGGLSTIIFEMGFIFLIFFPRLRWLAVAGGLSFHTFTKYFMQIGFENLKNFYFVFFPLDRILSWAGKRIFPEKMTVFFDGNCKLCRRTIATLRVFDVFERIRYLNALSVQSGPQLRESGLSEEAVLRDMCAVCGGKVYKGYDSYRALAFRIPFLWPALPFLFLWPVTAIGRGIYRKVADSRVCTIPEKRFELAEAPPEGMSKSLVIAAFILIAMNSFCGVRDIRAGWPFASYPGFSDIPSTVQGTLEFEITDQNGKIFLLQNMDYAKKFSPERFVFLVSKILYREPDLREKRLKALWSVMAGKWPELSSAQSVRFYEVRKSRVPEESHRNPLSRTLIYELKLNQAAI